ncbi:MAG: FecR family protein [Thiobacillus sp.]|nr:FecR family protein [Hydrogenophaga sp.]MBW8468195.1 FecR family protein [Thiobacillus sp.]
MYLFSRVSLVAALALTTSLAIGQTTTTDATGSARIGTFKHVEGDTRIGRADATRTPAPGEGVRETDRIRTGRNGAASLTLKDGTVLVMGPDTTVDLTRFQFDTTTQKGHFALDLLQGSVRVITGLLAKINPDLFKVSTPTSVVGVRGTDFIVEAAPPPQVPPPRVRNGPLKAPAT